MWLHEHTEQKVGPGEDLPGSDGLAQDGRSNHRPWDTAVRCINPAGPGVALGGEAQDPTWSTQKGGSTLADGPRGLSS